MLHAISTRFTESLYLHCNLDVSKKAVYVYGIELLLSTFSSVFSVLLLSLLFWEITDAILFLVIYISFRAFCGGYHAKTYTRCFVCTNLTFIAVNLFAHICRSTWFVSALFMLSALIVVTFAPIRSVRHSLSHKRLCLNRRLALVLLGLFAIVFWGSVLNRQFLFWHYLSVSSLTAVAVFMVVAKFQERRVRDDCLVCTRKCD